MDEGNVPGAMPAAARSRGIGAWFDRPAGRPVVLLLGLLIVVAPWWLMADSFEGFAIGSTDVIYLEEARDARALRESLWAPLNTHIVPLFRLWTYVLVIAAGRLEMLPRLLLGASYLGLVVTMLLVGHLVRQETGRTGLALGAMAFLGISTVVQPTVAYYAAGQALLAGAAIVATLVAVRAWRMKGHTWRLVVVGLGVLAAPAIWSGGLTAGPAAAAALWADGRTRCRRAAVGLVALMGAAGLAIVWLSRRNIEQTSVVWEHHQELWPRPIQAVLNTLQAVTEVLLLNNLGLDALTSPLQAVVIVAAVAGLWYASRGRFGRVTPLEAAGAATAAFSALMIYFFRGNLPYSSVRPVTWYHAIPQVGAVMLAAGWWAGVGRDAPRAEGRLSRGGVLAVLGLVLVLGGIQAERARRLLIEAAPPLSASELAQFPTPELQRLRALCLNGELAARQRRMLARLDQVERTAQRLRIGKSAIRRTFGRVLMPGIPEQQAEFDAASLLRLPEGEPNLDPDWVRAALSDLYRAEPEPRPPWLLANEPWPSIPSSSP